MINETIDLYKHFGIERPEGAAGYLTVYAHPVQQEFSKNRIRPAMLVLPGGGYGYCSFREKEPIVMPYFTAGFNCFCLDYSVMEMAKYPTPVIEAVMAMLYIRETAEELHTNADKVCSIGFSAGGHLNGMLNTAYDNKEIVQVLGERAKEAKPNATIFAYAVITTENTHANSIKNITGGDPELLPLVHIANNVNENTAPAFIWTTVNDGTVPSENTLALACAYKKAGVPFELHMFENGTHGLSTATAEVNSPNAPVSVWIDLSLTWLRNRGFVFIVKE